MHHEILVLFLLTVNLSEYIANIRLIQIKILINNFMLWHKAETVISMNTAKKRNKAATSTYSLIECSNTFTKDQDICIGHSLYEFTKLLI